MQQPKNLPLFTGLAAAMLAACFAADAAPKPPSLKGTEFLQSLVGSCPSAYTQYPNAPITEYLGMDRLLTSQLIARVASSDILQDQQAKTQPYASLPLPGGGTLGGYNPPNQGADLYRVHYRSTNVRGEPTLVSGLVALPAESMTGGIVVYTHATQVSQSAGAPSKPSVEACSMITALAGKERIVAMPDYLGFGINNDIHPYPLGVQNAPAGLDIITAARELAGQIHPDLPLGGAVSVTGYSEGGGNALWLGRRLQEQGQPPALIAPMSGDYDITGATAHSLIVNQPPVAVTLAAKPLLLVFTAQAAWEIANLDPISLIDAPLVAWDNTNPLPLTASGITEIGLDMAALMTTAYQQGYVKKSFNPDILMNPELEANIVIRNCLAQPVKLWCENDNIDWTPTVPIYATGILQDQIVPFAGFLYPVPAGYTGGRPFFQSGNSENLIKAMRQKGIGADRVAWFGIDAAKVTVPSGKSTKTQTINHVNGLVPVSILAARAIEQGGMANLPQLPDPK